MKLPKINTSYIAGCVMVIALFLLGITSKAQNINSDQVDGKIYFKFKNNTNIILEPFDRRVATDMNQLYSQFPLIKEIISEYQVSSIKCPFLVLKDAVMSKTYEVQFDKISDVDQLINLLKSNELIEYAEPVALYKQQTLPPVNDVDPNQWYLSKIQAMQAWSLSAGSPSVVVAIVDGGAWMTHSDLIANRWKNPGEIAGNSIDDDADGYVDDVNGYDVADGDNNPIPPTSETHATAIAGCISANTNNGTGIASIGYNVSMMDVKVKTDAGCFCYADAGLTYAIAAGANIINMSYGSTSYSSTTQNLLNTAHNKGIVLVAAAGNYSSTTLFYPAACNYVIAVGETNSSDVVDTYSDYGSWVDLMAPGIGIYTTLPTNTYGNEDGTSFASPIVAGAAALMLSYNNSLTPDQLEACLKQGCDNINSLNSSKVGLMGAGRLNVYNSMLCAQSSTGVVDIVNENKISVFPNPSKSIVTVQFKMEKEQTVKLELLNVLGQPVLISNEISSPQIFNKELNISDIPSGIYLLKISWGEESRVLRIIKEE